MKSLYITSTSIMFEQDGKVKYLYYKWLPNAGIECETISEYEPLSVSSPVDGSLLAYYHEMKDRIDAVIKAKRDLIDYNLEQSLLI